MIHYLINNIYLYFLIEMVFNVCIYVYILFLLLLSWCDSKVDLYIGRESTGRETGKSQHCALVVSVL